MAIPPGTYIERELKSKEEHEAGVAAAPPQPAHTAPSPPRRERERERERATDRPLLLRRPLSCFNCGIEHVQRQLANTTYLPLRPAPAFQRVLSRPLSAGRASNERRAERSREAARNAPIA